MEKLSSTLRPAGRFLNQQGAPQGLLWSVHAKPEDLIVPMTWPEAEDSGGMARPRSGHQGGKGSQAWTPSCWAPSGLTNWQCDSSKLPRSQLTRSLPTRATNLFPYFTCFCPPSQILVCKSPCPADTWRLLRVVSGWVMSWGTFKQTNTSKSSRGLRFNPQEVKEPGFPGKSESSCC